MPPQTPDTALHEILNRITASSFADAVFHTVRSDGKKLRTRLRPVQIKGLPMVQASAFDGKKTDVKNFGQPDVANLVTGLLQSDIRSVSVGTETELLQVQYTKKGGALIGVKPRTVPVTPEPAHDRVIPRPFPDGTFNPFLHAVGLMTLEGKVKADRQRKFLQINEFIKLVTEGANLADFKGQSLRIFDFGCGNAYLSFGLHYYLKHHLGVQATLVGVDRNSELIARNNQKAEELAEKEIEFVTASIADFEALGGADLVTCLHACDTATDEALSKALALDASLIFAAPCCHHNIQAQLSRISNAGPLRSLMEDGIVRERLGDLITDTLRALILRIAGYDVDIIEFTSPEHTAKNLMIRAKRALRPVEGRWLAEYQALKLEFQVTPYLEGLVSPELRSTLTNPYGPASSPE